MRVAVLYIAIGEYKVFWNDFYLSSECFFLKEVDKEYFIFSDSDDFVIGSNVHIVPVLNNGWPRNTLDRFFFFHNIQDSLFKFDFCYFFNSNTKFLKEIRINEITPTVENDFLVNLSWHIYDEKDNKSFPYERNSSSTAYIPTGEGKKYYQGGLIGARTNEFLEMTNFMIERVAIDYKNNVIAINHDESHLNKYLIDKSPLVLSSYYGRPEEWTYPADPMIIFRKKEKILGELYMSKLKKKSVLYLIRNMYAKLVEIFKF